MRTLAPGYGRQVSELACSLDDYGESILQHVDTTELNRRREAVNDTAYQIRIAERELHRVEADLRRLEDEYVGYQRTLEMVSHMNPTDDALRARLMQRVDDRREQFIELSADTAFLRERMRTLTVDLRGMHAAAIETLEACIERAAETKRREANRQRRREIQRSTTVLSSYTDPMWSPVALIGYRVWKMRPDGMYGAWQRWRSPHLQATCRRGKGVPHTNGQCNDIAFGCGIYAAKDPKQLLRSYGLDPSSHVAVGLVALEGRVVEHDAGYRAEQVRVAALITADEGIARAIEDQDELECVFKDPGTRTRLGTEIGIPSESAKQFREAIGQYLKEREPGGTPWT